MSYKPSKYQSDVISFVQNETGNGVIEAKAGSGKTTSLMMVMNAIYDMDKTKSVLFLAFNKAIATTLDTKVKEGGYNNVKACTLNSYGNSLIYKNIKGYVKLDADKSMTLLRFKILNVVKGDKPSEEWFYAIRHAVKKVVSLLKANFIVKPTHADVMRMMETYDITLRTVKEDKLPMFYDNCIATFTLAINTLKTIDFDDQIFLPLYHKWDMGHFDFVLVDECQDLNPVQIEFIKKLI